MLPLPHPSWIPAFAGVTSLGLSYQSMARRILGWLALILIITGLYWGLVEAPPDARQGETQRIMYLHIPSILVASLSFFIVFVGSCLYLWKGERRDDNLAHAAAEIGVLFTALTIVEGSIWGKPTWGVWWTWDARLTLTAILLLIFSGYLLLRSLIEDQRRAAVSGAILGIIGFLDIPLIHMSVYWWRTLHQPPSILRPDKAPWDNIDPAMLWPLGINFLAFLLLFFYLLSLRIRLGEVEDEARRSRLYDASSPA